MQQENKQKESGLGAEVIKCIRCGACQVVCPIFKESSIESHTARGKVRLIRAVLEDKLNLSGEFEDLLSHCLLCRACVQICPAGVKTDELVQATRSQVVAEKGLPLVKKLAFRVGLKNRWLFNSVMAALPGIQWLMFRRAPNDAGMLPRYPLGLDKRRLTHPVAKKAFRSTVPELVKADKPNGKKVALFTGCMGNFIYPETAMAATKVLNTNGFDVIIPRHQHCCGTPVRVSGDFASAVEMAKVNVDEFFPLLNQVDAIIVLCGSCGMSLKKESVALLVEDPVYGPKAAAMAGKIKDITEFIIALPNWQKHIVNSLQTNVTYHDPCHLARGMKVVAQPRQIIKTIPGVNLVELPRDQVCCGGAGTFSVSHYDLSSRITKRKVKDIEMTGANILATGCSACRMQIEDGIYQAGLQVKALHTVELLWQAYRPTT
ncbi:(Fe-S)-binding protein [Desulfotomaculum nigrificans]|uniref:(Fe-S)-binding protein n=1 Tax=Desulfotomaculum nigrificans TaxID=1565 RepID=UPI0001FAEC80|nr:(Fe-S)-binding protein [Desulfotomaculum nigrificans]